MPVNIDDEYRAKISRVVKRNIERENPISGIFTILSCCRQRTEGHAQAVKLSRMNKGQSRVVSGFNLIASMEGRTPLFDAAGVTHAPPSGGSLVYN